MLLLPGLPDAGDEGAVAPVAPVACEVEDAGAGAAEAEAAEELGGGLALTLMASSCAPSLNPYLRLYVGSSPSGTSMLLPLRSDYETLPTHFTIHRNIPCFGPVTHLSGLSWHLTGTCGFAIVLPTLLAVSPVTLQRYRVLYCGQPAVHPKRVA